SINVLHDRNPLYVELRDGSVRNGFDVKILNMTPEPRSVTLHLSGLEGARMALADSAEESAALRLELVPDGVLPLRLYVRVGSDSLPSAQQRFDIVVESEDGAIRASSAAH